MMLATFFLLLQAQSGPWDKHATAPERLSSGPHTLVISDGNGMMRIDYKTGPQCQKAKDEVRRQNAPGPIIRSEGGGVLIPPPSRVKAFCVPR